jgi:hypothetical protein
MNINYQLKLEEIIENNKKNNIIPTLLLHSCCAPCSSYVLEYLSNYFEITILYYNPNIYPNTEYKRRAQEQQEFIQKLNTKYPIRFIEGTYNEEKFYNITVGLEDELEGGKRCFKCYNLRLEETARLAKELNFDYFTTTLSISPYKNSKKLNEIGELLGSVYNTNYLYADFKKKDGYKRSIELSKIYKLYRQDYCGCKFSYDASLNREKKNENHS